MMRMSFCNLTVSNNYKNVLRDILIIKVFYEIWSSITEYTFSGISI